MKRKTIRLYPYEYLEHRDILKWLEKQPGTDNENLIHLMTQGLKLETGEISRSENSNSPKATVDTLALLP